MSQLPSLPEPTPESLPDPIPDPAMELTSVTKLASELDEIKLVAFLQAHAPLVPVASADLEDRVMAAIATEIAAEPVQQPARRHLKLKMLLGLTAGTIFVGAGWSWARQMWQPGPQPALQMVQLEQFLETSWDVTLTDVDNSTSTSSSDISSPDSGEVLHFDF